MDGPSFSFFFYKAPITLTLPPTFHYIWAAVRFTPQYHGLCHRLITYPVSQ